MHLPCALLYCLVNLCFLIDLEIYIYLYTFLDNKQIQIQIQIQNPNDIPLAIFYDEFS